MQTKLEKFISESSLKHNNKYDYSLVEYINAHTHVQIICPEHGSFLQTPADHKLKGAGCKICAKASRIATNLVKYGTPHPTQNVEVQERRKQTNLIKYGVENPSQNKKVRVKLEQTNLTKYGGTCYMGVKWALFRDKRTQTMLDRYGVEHFTNREKAIVTNQQRYGTPSTGNKHILQSLHLLNNFDWMCHQYLELNKSSPQLAEELNVNPQTVLNYLHFHGISVDNTYAHQYSRKAIRWLDHVSQKENIKIQHAVNGGEYTILGTRFRADGFCEETNTIYEFYGDRFHGNPMIFATEDKCHPYDNDITAGELYALTIERERLIIKMGYNLVIMWEHNYSVRATDTINV